MYLSLEQVREMQRWGIDPFARPVEFDIVAARKACRETATAIVHNVIVPAACAALAEAFAGARDSIRAEQGGEAATAGTAFVTAT